MLLLSLFRRGTGHAQQSRAVLGVGPLCASACGVRTPADRQHALQGVGRLLRAQHQPRQLGVAVGLRRRRREAGG